jgi:Fe2+ or Zn2+ uptake regulation protein
MLGYQIESKERKYIMNDVDNKELLLKAIDSYSLFTVTQKKLLKTLVNMAVDNVVVASIVDLRKIINSSRVTIYSALEFFEKEGVIEILNTKGKKFNSYRLKQSKLNEIINHYVKKMEVIEK